MTDVERLAEMLREADYGLSDSADILAERLIAAGATFCRFAKKHKAHKKIKLYQCNKCGAIKTHKNHACISGDGYTLIEGEAVFPVESE